MRDMPILFSDPLVRAILNGWKTQTRRAGPMASRFDGLEAGDRLWVREVWRPAAGTDGYLYRATPPLDGVGQWAWRPSIHMPRRACRLVLEVTRPTRQQRLHSITNADARAEGIRHSFMDPYHWTVPGESAMGPHFTSARKAFKALWDGRNAKRGLAWAENPVVRVLDFKVAPYA